MSGVLRPGWNIENHETGSAPRWPVTREEITSLEDAEGNEVRVGDRVRSVSRSRSLSHAPSYGWHFSEAWVVELAPQFVQDDSISGRGRRIDKLSSYTGFRVRSDDGIETTFNASDTAKVELSEEALAEVLDRAYRHAIRRTEDIIEEYEAWLGKLKRRRAQIQQGVA